MGARSSSALTKAVRSVPALGRSTLRCSRAVLWSLHGLSLAIHIGAVAGAAHFALVRRSVVRCRILARLVRRLCLRDYVLGEEGNS
jgi:hypothetical protein